MATSGSHPETAAILADAGRPGPSLAGSGVVTTAVGPGRRGPRLASARPAAGWRPVLSIVGLLVVGLRHAQPAQRQRPVRRVERTANGNGNGDGAARTRRRRPSNVVIVPPEVVVVPGSIVYAKAGNIWVQTGKDAHQLTIGRQRFDAVVVARRHDRLLHPDGRRRSAAGPPASVLRDYQMTIAERHARQGRRQRRCRSWS